MKLMSFLKLQNESEIHYELGNEGKSSIPVIFVNGSIFNFKQWYPAYLPTFKTLSDNKFTYLLYDYEGIGLSSFKKDKFSMLQLVDELKQILDHLHFDKVHLFGVSKGSMVSQAFAGTYPDRVASLSGYGVINLLSSVEELSGTRQDFIDRLKALEPFRPHFNERMNKQLFNVIMKDVYTPVMFFKEYNQLSFKERIIFRIASRKVWPMLDQSPIGTMELLFNYYVNDLVNERPLFEGYVENLKKLPSILWLNGTADKTAPTPLVEKLAEILPNSSLIKFEGYGHIPPSLNKKQAGNIMESYVSFLFNLPSQT